MVRTALVIGINHYIHFGPERQLQAPARDAELIARRLEQDGFWNVIRLPEVTLKNGQRQVSTQNAVTAEELEAAITALFYPNTQKNIPDAALLYFSGHGVRQDKGWKTKGFLAASDVDLQGNWGFPLEELREMLKASPVRAQVVWLDCCYSGELLNFEEGNPGEQGQARDRCFIAASQDHEVAYEAVDVPYSELTRSLWQGLNTEENGVSSFDLQQFIDRSFQGKQRPLFHTSGNAIPLIPASQFIQTSAKVDFEDYLYNSQNPNYFDYSVNRKTLLRPTFNVGNKGEITIIGPANSGKTTFLAALASWHDLGFRKPLKAVEPINQDSLNLKRLAENILKTGQVLQQTPFPDLWRIPYYLFLLEITPNFWHNPLCWLFKRNVRFSLSCKDFPGEFLEVLQRHNDFESQIIDEFVNDCAFSSGFLVMIDATDSSYYIDDKYLSKLFSTLCKELTFRIKRGGWKVKYRIAVVFSKADQYKIWKYRKRLKKFMSMNFPYTQNVFQEWSRDGYCIVEYFSCSAFGMRGEPPQPNVTSGVNGSIADPIAWQPFGLASAIYWLSTGKIDARLL